MANEPEVHEPGHLLAQLYREATSLTEAALRLVAMLPDATGAQLQQADGIEAVLASATHCLDSLQNCFRLERDRQERLNQLAAFLDDLEAGTSVDLAVLTGLAESLVVEAAEGVPIHFYQPPPATPDRSWVARLVAGHSLTVAQVLARLARHEPELRGRLVEAVSVALLHDVGMLRLPPELLAKAGPLSSEEKRRVEQHTRVGEELTAALPLSPWVAEGAHCHHERLNGTGYPDGLGETRLSLVVRLLAVCDVYAASSSPRPHRPARETRTALTDVLLLAEQGQLDRRCAERLLHLGFYPAGSVVEMADGSIAYVVAARAGGDLPTPARPVVALLTDSQGRFLSCPRHLDLAHADSHSVVRTLSPSERRRALGTRYPEWAL
jgi:HD-GYP domain-containing protein (c-di-GMP phosphodiesterase class II)